MVGIPWPEVRQRARQLIREGNLYFHRGNRKLNKVILTFNLPANLSCLYADAFCRKFCYAKKREAIPQVLARRIANWLLTMKEDFVEKAVKEIKRHRKAVAVRIHESGDFYSVEYFLKWCEVAKQIPDKIFVAYTRHPSLPAEAKPQNFLLYYSVNKVKMLREENVPASYDGITAILLPGSKVPKGMKVCRAGKDKCLTNCFYCYKATKFKKVVAFELH